ncbi:hypothetical protein RDI58_003974 [Solanum bulbocastanum]|uniref:Uncharacterized protein n=1 Tax=Solanum bulbocastanum TaxID=147425 RepID=A0AAN8YPH4_SOLBU
MLEEEQKVKEIEESGNKAINTTPGEQRSNNMGNINNLTTPIDEVVKVYNKKGIGSITISENTNSVKNDDGEEKYQNGRNDGDTGKEMTKEGHERASLTKETIVDLTSRNMLDEINNSCSNRTIFEVGRNVDDDLLKGPNLIEDNEEELQLRKDTEENDDM